MTDFPQIECKKHAYRQTQDGMVISFVIHPNDVSPELASAPLGTRYMAVLVELNDNETAKPPQENHTLSQQAGILCGEPRFLRFLWEKYPHIEAPENDFEAAETIREICGVESRKEFDTDAAAGQRWRSLKAQYDAWKAL